MTSAFEILPAIDLRGGRVVRLQQGDFARETVFGDDPVAVAESFAQQGARWLHVVDLDGARSGTSAHVEVIARIVAAVDPTVAVEVAGGMRSAADVERVLASGAARVVIGTAAIADPSFASGLVERHGSDRIVVAVDVREGQAIGHGWVAGAVGVPVPAALDALTAAGVTVFEVTAIARDGLADGPDLGLYRDLVGRVDGRVIASGGIRDGADIEAARAAGCAGVIIGRALYDGSLSLSAALAAVGAGWPGGQ
jgi:phosphoribosylformimino-5-aminoimidazole carboxamide ribotide isomerase